MRVRRTVGLLALGVMLAGCTFGQRTPGPATSSAAATAGTAARATAAPATTSGWQPVWQGSVAFAGGSGAPVATRVRLYPLLRVGTRVLLTVDLRVLSGRGKASLHPFCAGDGCWDLSGISLIDTAGLTRFGPSQAGVAGGPMLTSSTRGPGFSPGPTYRFGAVFADPGSGQVAVDLQQAGIVLQVPIMSAVLPAANLISTVSPSPRWNPEPVTVGTLVTAPVPALTGAFSDNRHGLVTSIAGAPASATPGIVTFSADSLFAAGSAQPVRAAVSSSGPLTRVAKTLAGRADPARPLLVLGYADAKGDPAAGLGLSQRRADAVAAALGLRLKKLKFVASGRGQADPIAANTTSDGRDSPSGRALNRRIVIAYAPKTPGAPGGAASAAGQAPSSTGPPSSAGSPSSAGTPPAAGQDAPPALVRLGPAVVSAAGRAARLSAGISAVRVDGGLSLVTVELRSDRRFVPGAAFSTAPGSSSGAGQSASGVRPGNDNRHSVGAFRLVDRGTGQVFVPARDADDQTRIAGAFTHRMEPRVSYVYSFLTAALPANLGTVDVALGDLGTARAVLVRR